MTARIAESAAYPLGTIPYGTLMLFTQRCTSGMEASPEPAANPDIPCEDSHVVWVSQVFSGTYKLFAEYDFMRDVTAKRRRNPCRNYYGHLEEFVVSYTTTYQSTKWFNQVEAVPSEWVILWSKQFHKNGCPAYCSTRPLQKAWVKPRRMDIAVPAREKISADLGHLLRLPVVSVLLCKATMPDGSTQPVAISKYSLSGNHLSWFRLQAQGVEPRVIAEVIDYFVNDMTITAGMWVFDTWIQNRDRTERNIMVGYTQGRLEHVYFYDFDHSMVWTGNPNNWTHVFIHQTVNQIFNRVKWEHCVPYLEKIESLPEDSIAAVINRIPHDYLPQERKALYQTVLLHRRQHLRSAFYDLFVRLDQKSQRSGQVWYPDWHAFQKVVIPANPQHSTDRAQSRDPG